MNKKVILNIISIILSTAGVMIFFYKGHIASGVICLPVVLFNLALLSENFGGTDL